MKRIALFFVFTFSLFLFGCRQKSKEILDGPSVLYEHPEYTCPYTEEENLKNIEKRTEEIFAKDMRLGIIVDYQVDILYAFDGDPEYFLIEIEYSEWYAENAGRSFERYAHCIGYINHTEYFVDLYFYEIDQVPIKDMKEVFRDGKSGYALYASPEEKRYYYEGLHCVERDGEIVVIQDLRCGANMHEHDDDSDCRVGSIIPKEQYGSYLILGREVPHTVYAKETVE